MARNLIIITVFFYCFLGNAQKISFDYDIAGNQVKRELCSSCPSKNGDENIIAIENLTEQDLLKFFPEDVISYYPNPVKEELFLKWNLIDGKNVNSIEIYSLNGQLVKKYTNLDVSNKLNIPFGNYREGVYMILLQYSNGEQKDIKIIKK
ncbi:hypothetical protein FLJC2902T_22660 [Flavobacterium limnosediminis JC2902]|uniref:Secretion system C-terminal sorting domain-containing protein n=1 Tax=Flavobacterium limnosediminis JC2902 TaxID=1341181 RepID=V6SK48_9FLAO|nr:T9SS type A sorting domain-containing protein [Flavobacterium limnosediminis]ESU27088.1 hypothetical protein FLJC2902T_22660 [Flavobacterium limnosediminis JC2902]